MAYKTPGVYVEEIAKLPPSVAEVETAIPAFIGYTKTQDSSRTKVYSVSSTPYNVQVERIESLSQFESVFGTTEDAAITVTIRDTMDGTALVSRTVSTSVTEVKNTLYYQLQMFFANGGGACYIASVGKTDAGIVEANALQAGVNAIAKYDEPTILVIPEAVKLSSAAISYNLYKSALTQAGLLKDRFVIVDCYGDDAATLRDAANGIGTSDLKYGAAYHPFLKTTLGYVYSDASVTVDHQTNTISNATYVAVNYGGAKLSNVKASSVAGHDAVYNLAKQSAAGLKLTLSPSAAIAGVYAAVDSSRGVWKAPANVGLAYVSGPTKPISDAAQEGLNVDADGGKSINAIRFFTGKGTLVWGARTLAGNDNEWRYISVRRFFNMVEESVKKATGGFVFEPNDANTWTKVQGMIENYLFTLWRAGALQGAKPEHAYYVAVGLNNTMTAQDILEGRMNIEIGMAAVRPAEFIILRFSHLLAQS